MQKACKGESQEVVEERARKAGWLVGYNHQGLCPRCWIVEKKRKEIKPTILPWAGYNMKTWKFVHRINKERAKKVLLRVGGWNLEFDRAICDNHYGVEITKDSAIVQFDDMYFLCTTKECICDEGDCSIYPACSECMKED
jgi:hypothetical protein